MATIRDVVQRRFRQSGLSINALAKQTGLNYQSVHGFLRGYRDLRVTNLDRVCKVLNLELRYVKRKGG